jgi:acetyl-CoA carboxylase biotin carboxyl carrier protein
LNPKKGIEEESVELKQIKELMAAMGRTGTKRIMLKKEGFELELEHEGNVNLRSFDSSIDFGEENFLHTDAALKRANIALSRAKDSAAPLPTAGSPNLPEKEDVNSIFVTSPMVGTYYSSPSPEDPSFVKVGDKIEKNTVVCIIEAMKVMNEIKAGVSGTVAEILIEGGQPVEFGSKLFRIL